MPRLLPAALLAALALAGCGGQEPDAGVDRFEGEGRKVAQVVEDLSTAGEARDAAEYCSRLLARELVDRIAAGPLDCEQEIEKGLEDADDAELTVRQVVLQGPNAATAEVRDGEDRARRLTFVRQDGRWRVASFG